MTRCPPGVFSQGDSSCSCAGWPLIMAQPTGELDATGAPLYRCALGTRGALILGVAAVAFGAGVVFLARRRRRRR